MPKLREWFENSISIVEGYTIVEDQYEVPMIKKEKHKKMNPKTNRIKTFRKQKFLKTDVPLEKRSFKNIPKYADGKNKVRFQDWLAIKGEGSKKMENGMTTPNTYGYSEALDAWVGWSHRAVASFKPGDEIKGDSLGKKVEYPKLPNGENDWDNPTYEPDFVIQSDEQARQIAYQFSRNVA